MKEQGENPKPLSSNNEETIPKLSCCMILLAIKIFISVQIGLFVILRLISFNIVYIYIPFYVVLNYFFIRSVGNRVVFIGSNFFARKINTYRYGSQQAMELKAKITDLKNTMEGFREITSSFTKVDLEGMYDSLTSDIETIDYYITICLKTKEKYSSSGYREDLTAVLQRLKESFDLSNILGILSDGIKESYRNNGVYDLDNAELIVHIKTITAEADNSILLINRYLGHGGFFSKVKNFFMNDTFGSIEIYRSELMVKFHVDEYNLRTKDKCLINMFVIRSQNDVLRMPNSEHKKETMKFQAANFDIASNGSSDKKYAPTDTPSTENRATDTPIVSNKSLMIVCGPNGVNFETFSQSRWVEFYIDCGINVLLWNYRGYGFSTGSPTINNISDDAEAVAEFAKQSLHYKKVGVHGISIGSIPACQLAARNKVDFCFADRAFSTLEGVIEGLKYGKFLKKLHKFFCLSDHSNTEAYLHSTCFKLISCDPNDNFIRDESSLKTAVSKSIIALLKKQKKIYTEPSSRYHLDLIKFIFEDKDTKGLISSLSYLIERIRENIIESKVEDEKITYFSSLKKDKDGKRYGKLQDDLPSTLRIKDKTNRTSQIEEEKKEQEKIFSKELSESFVSNVSFNEGDALSSLQMSLDNFDSAGLTLLDYNKTSCSDLAKFINNFFSNLLIFGSYKTGTTEITTDRNLVFKTVAKKISLLLQKLGKTYFAMSNSNVPSKQLMLKYRMRMLINFFFRIEAVFNKVLFKGLEEDKSFNLSKNQVDVSLSVSLDSINKDTFRNTELSEDFEALNTGYLLPLSCGHNGYFSTSEYSAYQSYLQKAGFIEQQI